MPFGLPALEPDELPEDAIEVGRIADAWGVKGWFKVLPYSASPEALFSSRRWFIQPAAGRKPNPADATRRLRVRQAREHAGAIVASAHDVDGRDAAEALRGARIFIARASFPTPGKDEYYWVDLIGLDVVNREGQALGQVHDLLATGAQTVLVLQAPASASGSKPVERMIPFVAAYVDTVDLAGRRIMVDWQTDY